PKVKLQVEQPIHGKKDWPKWLLILKQSGWEPSWIENQSEIVNDNDFKDESYGGLAPAMAMIDTLCTTFREC
ncbi:16120_t:CDS:2, partial [Gigaspora rosea]